MKQGGEISQDYIGEIIDGKRAKGVVLSFNDHPNNPHYWVDAHTESNDWFLLEVIRGTIVLAWDEAINSVAKWMYRSGVPAYAFDAKLVNMVADFGTPKMREQLNNLIYNDDEKGSIGDPSGDDITTVRDRLFETRGILLCSLHNVFHPDNSVKREGQAWSVYGRHLQNLGVKEKVLDGVYVEYTLPDGITFIAEKMDDQFSKSKPYHPVEW